MGFINTLLEYLFFYIHVISNLTSYRDRDSISRLHHLDPLLEMKRKFPKKMLKTYVIVETSSSVQSCQGIRALDQTE